MDGLIEAMRSNIITGQDIASQLKIKSKPFDEISIKKSLITEYEAEGWYVQREKKKVAVIRRKKSHDKEFEDRVWTIFARMGFKYLNGRNFKLNYTNGLETPGKQIDVFVADDESILVIECKSSEEIKKKSLQVYINELTTVMTGSRQYLKKLFSNDHKIKFLLATNRIILTENDKKRLYDSSIEHFNQDDIDYYEQLINRIGKAARYQLLGRLFQNQEIPGMEYKIPAVRGKMGGYNYYSFTIEPEKLLKIGYILHRMNVHEDDEGYQRMVTRKRLLQIERFINKGGYFPNSIIINLNSKKDAPLNFDRLKGMHHSNISESVILHLPKKYHSAFIIDGQHRLYGYANTDWKNKNSIPVVAFENLPAKEQVNLFIQINSKQKPVSKNLLTTIISDLMWNSDRYDEALEALKSRLLVRLGERDDSPLYGRVLLGDKSKTDVRCITLDTIVTYGFNRSKFFAKISKGKPVELGHLWINPEKEDGTIDYSPMLDKCFSFFAKLFDYVSEKTVKTWLLGNKLGGFISVNIGVLSTIRISSDIIDHLKFDEGLETYSKKGDELAEATFKYLEVFINHINTLDIEKIIQFRRMGASAAGAENVIREFQKIIHDSYNDFNPTGLEQWIKDNSGKYNDVAKKFIENIELGIRNMVLETLKVQLGERWWIDGVPLDIQSDAARKRINQKSEEPDYNFLELIEYKKIIEKSWSYFKEDFADPCFKSGKENQLKWFDALNKVRNKVAHPGRAKVTEAEYEFLLNLDKWLPLRIGTSRIFFVAA